MIRIRNLLILLKGQLWVLPLLISAVGLALAFVILTYGGSALRALIGEDARFWWLYSGDAGTARGLLSSMLSGLMTMISLIVSVTFVILTLAANQLGPRLVPTFLSDRQIQTVLGLFLGTILYVLVVLRSINDTLGADGAPHIAVTVASFLTIACLFALLFYVHKVARSIVADNIIEIVAGDLSRNIRGILDEDSSQEQPRSERLPGPPIAQVSLGRSGSIQVIDYDALVAIAAEHDIALDVRVRAGHFVLSQGAHVVVHGGAPPADEIVADIREAFVLGPERSPAQDLEFGVRQLVEIALRALSPGINDPFTAVAVVDRLGAALEEIGRRAPQSAVLRDEDDVLRVIADRSDIGGLVDAAFDAIRQAGSDVPTVLIRMADMLGQLADSLARTDALAALGRHLGKLEETVRAGHFAASDRRDMLERIDGAREALRRASAAPALDPATQ
jgi:uncharacterized membrane protein